MFSLLQVRARNVLLSGLIVGIAGCANSVTDGATVTGQATAKGQAASLAATSADSFAQTSWELTRWVSSASGNRTIPHGDGAEPIRLVFLAQGKEYRVNGYSGCNRYTGNYRLQDGKLSISVLGQTRMACLSPEQAEFEQAYLKALAEIQSFTLDSGGAPRHLTFNLQNGDVLEFVRKQDPPTPR